MGVHLANAVEVTFHYRPARVPVIWAETFEEIPPWDWRRGTSPTQAWSGTREEVASRSFFINVKPAPESIIFPCLVRDHACFVDLEPTPQNVSLTMAGLWEQARLKSPTDPDSSEGFRNAIPAVAERVGLLSQGNPRGGGEAISDWAYAAQEAHFWRELAVLLREARDGETYPLPLEFWDDARHEMGLKTALNADNRPANANFIGHGRTTLDLPRKGVEIEFGKWFSLPMEHHETQRAIKIGAIRPAEEVPWYTEDSPNIQIALAKLFTTAMDVTRLCGNHLETLRALGEFLFSKFLDATVQAYGLTPVSSDVDSSPSEKAVGGFAARVGALEWSWFETSQSYRSDGWHICANPRCPRDRVFVAKLPSERYCSKACSESAKQQRRRDKPRDSVTKP
jgi:hypothetical protein